ncbi:MAG: NAD(P)H-dependent oxidoreductase [Bacteroidota bacterium]|nr:NAD(P)H-dependent oxidoreductase [Bacteroidota bacterium]
MNICIISGSPRWNSNTVKLAKAIESLAKEHHEVSVIDFAHYDIPLEGQGKMEHGSLSNFQQTLYNDMEKAELVFILSPEYNWMPSAEIVNFFNQMTGKEYTTMWHNKVFALAGVSNGRGGRMPIIQMGIMLNKVLGIMNYHSFICPRYFEGYSTHEHIDETGSSKGNLQYDKSMKNFVDIAASYAAKWAAGA